MRKRDNTERRIREYIQHATEHNNVLREPISEIASKTGCSVTTAWRVIKKLEDKRVIKIVKSKLKTEADTIYYLGEKNDAMPIMNQLAKNLNSINILILELGKQLTMKQAALDEAQLELKKYKDREKEILNVVKEK